MTTTRSSRTALLARSFRFIAGVGLIIALIAAPERRSSSVMPSARRLRNGFSATWPSQTDPAHFRAVILPYLKRTWRPTKHDSATNVPDVLRRRDVAEWHVCDLSRCLNQGCLRQQSGCVATMPRGPSLTHIGPGLCRRRPAHERTWRIRLQVVRVVTSRLRAVRGRSKGFCAARARRVARFPGLSGTDGQLHN